MKLKPIIEKLLNEHESVLVAVTCSNNCHWAYLTTSGKVCREEFGFEEDTSDYENDGNIRIDLPYMTWSSIKRLQRCLINLSNS